MNDDILRPVDYTTPEPEPLRCASRVYVSVSHEHPSVRLLLTDGADGSIGQVLLTVGQASELARALITGTMHVCGEA